MEIDCDKLIDVTFDILKHAGVDSSDKKRIKKEVLRFSKIYYKGATLETDQLYSILDELEGLLHKLEEKDFFHNFDNE